MKVTITKLAGDGEQVSIETVIPDAKIGKDMDLRAHLAPAFRLVDDRLLEMNMRIIYSNKRVRKLTPEAMMTIHEVFGLLHGKYSPQVVFEMDGEVIESKQAEDAQLRKVEGEQSLLADEDATL